jgi:hypothetical protein
MWPVFGCSFAAIHTDGQAGEHEVPLFVSRCVDHIDREGLDIEGIYRLSGQFQRISDVKATLNAGKDVDFAAVGQDVHVVAGLLKQVGRGAAFYFFFFFTHLHLHFTHTCKHMHSGCASWRSRS